MKLNRRKAMAAMVGGASTAPQAARAFAENIAGASQFDYGEVQQTNIFDPIAHAQKLAQQKEYLTKIANGDLDGTWGGEQINKHIKEYIKTVKDYHVDSLKSVSFVNKQRIKHGEQLEQIKQDWISDAKKQLLAFLNKKPGDIF